jgi:hypothetical protein
MVEADLPEECDLSSDTTGVELLRVLGSMREVDGQQQRRESPSTIDDNNTSKNSSRQKRKRGPSDIIAAIKEVGASCTEKNTLH